MSDRIKWRHFSIQKVKAQLHFNIVMLSKNTSLAIIECPHSEPKECVSVSFAKEIRSLCGDSILHKAYTNYICKERATWSVLATCDTDVWLAWLKASLHWGACHWDSVVLRRTCVNDMSMLSSWYFLVIHQAFITQSDMSHNWYHTSDYGVTMEDCCKRTMCKS